jgi:transposase
MKSLLETGPIYHKCDETIQGHVFCSSLALVLRKELQDRLSESPTRSTFTPETGTFSAPATQRTRPYAFAAGS